MKKIIINKRRQNIIVIMLLLLFVSVVWFCDLNNAQASQNTASNVNINTLFSPKQGESNGSEKCTVANSQNSLPDYALNFTNSGALIYLTKNNITASKMVSNTFKITDNTNNDLLLKVRSTPLINMYQTKIAGTEYEGNVNKTVTDGILPGARDLKITVSDALYPDVKLTIFWLYRAPVGTVSYNLANLSAWGENQTAGAERGDGNLRKGAALGALVSASYWGKGDDFIDLYYDYQANSLYTTMCDASGKATGKKLLRNFNSTYGDADNAWQGFKSGLVNVELEYGGGNATTCFLVTDLDGVNLSTDSDGFLLNQSIEDYNNDENTYFLAVSQKEIVFEEGLKTYKIPSLRKTNLFVKTIEDKELTANHYIKVFNSENEEMVVNSLNFGKWSQDAYFSPIKEGVYKVGYYSSLDLEPIYSINLKTVKQNKLNDILVSCLNDTMTINVVSGNSSYEYQYWIKSKIITDLNDQNNYNQQYAWSMISAFQKGRTVTTLDLSSIAAEIDGAYNIIVRVKDENSNFLNELFGSFSADDLGKVKINNYIIDGKVNENIYILQNSAEISIDAKNCDAYILDTGKDIYTSSTGKFNIDLGSYKSGHYTFKLKAKNQISEDVETVKVYIFSEYNASNSPIITSLKGLTNQETSDTVFTLKVKYADNSIIEEQDVEMFRINFSSNQQNFYYSSVEKSENNELIIKYNITYNNRYGIYYTVATINRIDGGDIDDKYILYYNGYCRQANLEQTSASYKYSANDTVEIRSTGQIENVDSSKLLYAYYREDASGWVLIKDYSLDNTLVWKPTKEGKYNISTRVKAVDGGSWEKSVTKTYLIGNELDVFVNLEIIDYTNGQKVSDNLIAGKPYIIRLGQGQDVDSLFMFTLSNSSLGTVYLNKYSTRNEYVFIPIKNDAITITGRIIDYKNYGYKDISKSIYFNTIVD